MPWYAVEGPIPRTGRREIEYVDAPNKTRAEAFMAGSTVVGGPYLTEKVAEKAFPGGTLGSIIPPAGEPPPTGNTNTSNPLAPLTDIGDFFHRLTEGETWTRVGEVLLGGILVYVGVRALAHGSPTAGAGARKAAARPVKRVATKAAKVAVPEARLATRTVAKRAAPKTTARVSAHRARVRKYGAKRPYQATPVKPRQPIQHKVVRESHIYHHKGPKP